MNKLSDIKAVAFYLPQYHQIPENDEWWGEGFTEWTNVKKGQPNFKGHYQPHVPLDIGYYNLLDPAAREAQANLARQHGLHGFCYYYYWFSGKKLLNKPIEEVLRLQQPDFPFCICWANESWSRTWEGKNEHILMEQEYNEDDPGNFIKDISPVLNDPRYITVDGKPVLLVYRVVDIPDPKKVVTIWRDYFRSVFGKELYLVSVKSFYDTNDPADYGFDAAVQFPPHQVTSLLDDAVELTNPHYDGRLCSYPGTAINCINRTEKNYKLFKGIIPGWDNTARRQDNAQIMVNNTPEVYEGWLNTIAEDTASRFSPAEQFVFINAWNEWGEGCHLEPDEKNGYAYLEATQRVVSGQSTARMPEYRSPPVKGQQSVKAERSKLLSKPVQPERTGQSNKVNKQHGFLSTVLYKIFNTLRAIYRKLPVSAHFKNRISTWFYIRFNSLRHWQQNRAYKARALQKKGDNQTAEIPRPQETLPEENPLVFEPVQQPEVSIIIAVYNKWEYTHACLQSILDNRPDTSFEVIIVDDCSTDITPQALQTVKGIRVITNEKNQGFLLNCNRAAKEASGNYLLFLNNDIKVLPGWLDELYQTFIQIPDAGLVGSKLVYPDGRLQEAGGVIWHDASGNNFGREDDPDKPEYCYLREPDYCSGASIMVPARVFESLGGFDERFVPAYYEDTDLAFSVRKMGLKVIYQPFSQVIHFEGVTSGTDIREGVKSYQEVNKSKFLEKWKDVLASGNPKSNSIEQDSERQAVKRALLVDFETPKPDIDSASVDTVFYLKMLQALGYTVSFIANDLTHSAHYTENLQRIGVKCFYRPYTNSIREHLEKYGSLYQLVLMHKAPFVDQYFEHVKKLCTQARLVFNTVDLHYVREQRYAELEDSDLLRKDAETTKKIETGIMRNTDATIVISQDEKTLVEQEVPGVNVFHIPYVRETKKVSNGFSDRKDIVFIGGFNHLPNIDAVRYFVNEIFPLVRARLPGVVFKIVGSNIPGPVFREKEVAQLVSASGVELVGYVEELDDTFNSCRVSLAPLRFGAGIKGKIGSSLCYGVPCVATPLAVEGMGLNHEQNVLVGEDAAAFAEQVIRVYSDEKLWSRISENGLDFMREHYSFEMGCKRLKALIDSL